MRRSLTAAITAVAATAIAVPLAAGGTAHAAAPAARAPRVPVTDFNHDGYADLAISAPYATVGGKTNAGYVAVVYGSKNGPDRAHPKILDRGTAGVPGEIEKDGTFGTQVTVGDLDGDGFTDLVVGSGYSDKLVALWGSKDGLSGAAQELPATSAGFATGDFDGDGHRDLVSNDYPDNDEDKEGMTVSYGPFTRDGKPQRQEAIHTSQTFGPAYLVPGDLNGDGIDDLVTAHGFEESAYPSRFWKGTKDGLTGTTQKLKSSLGGAVADVDGDGYGDFVTRDNGTSNDDNESDKGTVRVDYGSKNGPAATRTKKITQDSPGVPGVGETGDGFGSDISAGDVNGDGYADIAVGVPGEDIGSGSARVPDAGSFVLLKGSRTGLSGTGAQAFDQSKPGVPGASEKRDYFGNRVLLSDVNGDGKADLTVTARGEDGAYKDSGAAWYFPGARAGVTTTGLVSFGPKTLGAPETNATFGQDVGRY
ncbi:FG-GAP-like repeat-containing protein [Streptomyces sp. MNP-20]|uniref:FG-GAP-like repeat-containing protein n=1 Tax=Streptomyces sp. MNP-20 TaxID=2721165 RepID=UPI001552624D|nr:FG-GAP-like repeat-containing protein [Streptomyces sp. MNP-20]